MVKSPMSDVELMEIPIMDLILPAMEMHGDNVAMIDGVTEEKFTFAQTVSMIKRVSSGLVRLGIRRGDVIALISPNSPDYVIIFMASLAIGATITPINPVYTSYEINKQLENSGATYIYGHSTTIKKVFDAGEKLGRIKKYIVSGSFLEAISFETLLLDDGALFPQSLDLNPKEALAVIPYSSGTTGVPKGVMITHYNLVSQLLQIGHPDFVVPGADLSQKPVVMGFLPYFHVYGMFGVMTACLVRGAAQIIMPRFQPERVLQLIEKYKVTYMPSAPPVIVFLAKSPLVRRYDLSSLMSVGSGGAPLSAEVEKQLAESINVNEVSQGYGMTETTLCCASPGGYRPLRPGSVGVPIANCEMQVVDVSTKAILGPDQRGEVWVRGPNIMKGYLNRPDATRDTLDKEGWLHTGDIGYYDKDGYFYLVDRIKELIKYKGFQVAPAELEALLLTHPSIDDVAVIGIPDNEAGELPRAYVVTKPGKTLTEEEVKKHVADHVSSFKHLRGGVEFTATIPKSQAGKILRRQLKDKFTKSKL